MAPRVAVAESASLPVQLVSVPGKCIVKVKVHLVKVKVQIMKVKVHVVKGKVFLLRSACNHVWKIQ